MVARATARKDGVAPLAPRMSCAQLPTAAIMAPPATRTNLMVVLASVLKDGVAMPAALTSPAAVKTTAAVMEKLRTRTELTVATVSVPLDGKATVAMAR